MHPDFDDTSFLEASSWASQTRGRLDKIFDEFAAATPSRERFVGKAIHAYDCSYDLDERAEVRKLINVRDNVSDLEVLSAIGRRWDLVHFNQVAD